MERNFQRQTVAFDWQFRKQSLKFEFYERSIHQLKVKKKKECFDKVCILSIVRQS